MRWFRPAFANYMVDGPLTLDQVRAFVEGALLPGHFFVAPSLHLRWLPVASEEIRWELYQGRLLDPAHTRQMATFEAWSIYQVIDGQAAAEPLLSVKLNEAKRTVYVVRGLLCYTWEAHDAGGNVITSREATKWTRELVGSIYLQEKNSAWEFIDELIGLIWQAVVGTSRLPLTSLETPLPAFALGELGYCFMTGGNPS